MTVFESSMTLFTWFTDHDYFSIEKDFKMVIPISEDESKDKDSITLALKDLEEAGLISKPEESDTWVLKQKLGQANQEIAITYSTSLEIAAIVNSYIDIVGSENFLQSFQCDPSALTEQDIKSLCFITQLFIEKDSEVDNQSV